ncbi:MAG: DUF2231 domain-containing protein [Bacteroidota bacterium]
MPIHPFVVHFGIAFSWLAALGYLSMYLPHPPFSIKQIFIIHLGAVGGILGAIFSGLSAGDGLDLSLQAAELLQSHQLWGYISLWLIGLLGLWAYLRMSRWLKIEKLLFTCLFLLSCILMSVGTHLGGKMVYEEGVGVSGYQMEHEK